MEQAWRGVEAFVKVVDCGGFTAAASRMQVSVAHVSRQVSELERRLAAKLLNRSTRQVSLTEVGEVYYQRCRALLDGLDEAQREVNQMTRTPTGLLRLTAPVYYGSQFVAPVVNQFMARYPELRLEFTLTDACLDLIEASYDLAVRLGRLDDSALVARRLATRTQHVCASPGYLARKGAPQRLAQLGEHDCLVGSVERWRFSVDGEEQEVRVRYRWRCNSGLALRDAALRGLGLVQLPDYYVREALASGELVSVLDDYRLADEGIWAVYPPSRHQSLKVRLLVGELSAALGCEDQKRDSTLRPNRRPK